MPSDEAEKGGSLIAPESWEEPVRIRKKDGSFLTEDGITLDMTYLKAGERSYVVWSYRRNIGTPYDTGSMLYIAEVDEKQPGSFPANRCCLPGRFMAGRM